MSQATMWAGAACVAGAVVASKISNLNDTRKEYLPAWLKTRVHTQIVRIAELTAQSKQTTHPIKAFQLACESTYELYALRVVFGDDLLRSTLKYDTAVLQTKLNENMTELLRNLQTAFAIVPVTTSPGVKS